MDLRQCIPSCYLRVDSDRYLSSDVDYRYSMVYLSEKLYGKAIKPIRCYSRYSRYFIIDYDHIMHLVGVGVMAHDEQADVYWVAGDVVQTGVVSDEEFEDFKKKEGDKFIETSLFFFEVPKCIPENWDRLSDSQRERATVALTKGALYRMFCCYPRPDEAADAIWSGFFNKTIDCEDDVNTTVDAIEKEASSLVFDFDFSKAEVIIPVLRRVLGMMIDDIKDPSNAQNSGSRSEEDGLIEYDCIHWNEEED